MTEKNDRNIRKHCAISGNRYYCGAGTEYDSPYRLQNMFCLIYNSNSNNIHAEQSKMFLFLNRTRQMDLFLCLLISETALKSRKGKLVWQVS